MLKGGPNAKKSIWEMKLFLQEMGLNAVGYGLLFGITGG